MKAKIHYYDIGDYLSREDKLLDRSLYNQITQVSDLEYFDEK